MVSASGRVQQQCYQKSPMVANDPAEQQHALLPPRCLARHGTQLRSEGRVTLGGADERAVEPRRVADHSR
jgi:hypothetical protein